MCLGGPHPKACDTPLTRRCTPLYAVVRRCTLLCAVVRRCTLLYAVVRCCALLCAVVRCSVWWVGSHWGHPPPYPPDGVPVHTACSGGFLEYQSYSMLRSALPDVGRPYKWHCTAIHMQASLTCGVVAETARSCPFEDQCSSTTFAACPELLLPSDTTRPDQTNQGAP